METRSPERLQYQYEIERRLAARLRDAPKHERRHLYADVYDEFFRAVPDHPQLVTIADPITQVRDAARRAKCLSRFLTPACTFLEVGPGDCSLAIQVAKAVRKVYAVDVSAEITKGNTLPDNLELILSDGSSIPVAPGSVDVAFSDQLMEHLHPDDALDQLHNLYTALRPGGIYICMTPNRFSGPHDISKYFTDEPTGFHLREHSTTDLVRMLRAAGFKKVEVPVPARGRYVPLPCVLASGRTGLPAASTSGGCSTECWPQNSRAMACKRVRAPSDIGR
jgi:SAM-dependent methyltransferase